jgi:Bacterial PH domain
MDIETQRQITSELNSGERLIWTGRPGQGLIVRGRDAFPFIFGLFWLTLFIAAILWPGQRGNHPPPPPFAAVFLGVGLYVTFGRFLIDARRRRATYYGLTNERMIILSGVFRRKVRSLNLRSLSEVTLNQRRDGSGTIAFGGSESLWFMHGMDFWAPGAGTNALERIPNARQVYDQIRAAQRDAA